MNNNIYANEFEARDYILNKGKNCKSIEDLCELIKEVQNNFNTEYGVAPRSVGAVCAVVAEYLSNNMGLIGFQCNAVLWTFIYSFMYSNIKVGMKLVNFDEMLYPQYNEKFDKYISLDIWKNLQKEAKFELEKYKNTDNTAPYTCSPNLIEHWQSIVDGQVPFGYKVKD